jgi:hypothetical protein
MDRRRPALRGRGRGSRWCPESCAVCPRRSRTGDAVPSVAQRMPAGCACIRGEGFEVRWEARCNVRADPVTRGHDEVAGCAHDSANCTTHTARPISFASPSSSTNLPHTRRAPRLPHCLAIAPPLEPTSRALPTLLLRTTVSPREEQVASTQRTTARSRSYATLARAAMEKRTVLACGRRLRT